MSLGGAERKLLDNYLGNWVYLMHMYIMSYVMQIAGLHAHHRVASRVVRSLSLSLYIYIYIYIYIIHIHTFVSI